MSTTSLLAADIGKVGEESAASYLRLSGYRILERNYANSKGIRLGEIDIIAEKDHEIVFVEVKAVFLDSGKESRLPEWQVNRSKLRKMEKAAGAYLKERKIEDRDYSFDVVAVTFRPGKEPEIRHLDHVFFS